MHTGQAHTYCTNVYGKNTRIQRICITQGRRQSKTLILSTNVDQKSLETDIGDKWQSKTLFLSIFDPRSSIVKGVFGCSISDVNIIDKKLAQSHVPLYIALESEHEHKY